MNIRKIEEKDNPLIARIVKEAMEEFGADPKTTVLGDPSLHTMYQNYQEPRSVYFVVEVNGTVIGGCGLKHLDGSTENICELQRMFFTQEARGKGIGKKILEICVKEARNFNYKQMYIESLSNMHSAIALYEKSGFKRIPHALGKTGHGGCDVNMILDLEEKGED